MVFGSPLTTSHVEYVTLGNKYVVQLLGREYINLKMTYGKAISSIDVQHVVDFRRNLISRSLLIQNGFKIVLKVNHLVISKSNHFTGKGFVPDGQFTLNVCESSDLSFNEVVYVLLFHLLF